MKIRFKVLILLVALAVAVLAFFLYFNHYYPLHHKKEITNHAQAYNLNPALVAAVINTESSFKRDAHSSSNAIGLMQLRFSTAEEIASKLNHSPLQPDDLLNANLNIQYGCFYLRYLIDYYNGNMHNALCAYNAGLSNVNGWLADSNLSTDGQNLHHIPFTETRNYITRVHNYAKIYKYFYKL